MFNTSSAPLTAVVKNDTFFGDEVVLAKAATNKVVSFGDLNNNSTNVDDSKKQQSKENRKNHSLNLQFIKRLFHVLKFSITDSTLARSSCKSVMNAVFRASWVLLLLGCCIGEILIGNEVGKQSGNFTRSLLDSQLTNPKPFLQVLLLASVWIVGAACLKTVRQFIEEALALSWRSQLVHNVQHLYLQKDMFYKIAVLDQRIDNPFVSVF